MAVCCEHGCPVRVVRGRCQAHAKAYDQHRGQGADRQHKHLYDSARWKRLRRRVLAAYPWCQCDECRGVMYDSMSTVVHHIRPHGGDEAIFFDESNLQAMAKPCHDRETRRTQNSGGDE